IGDQLANVRLVIVAHAAANEHLFVTVGPADDPGVEWKPATDATRFWGVADVLSDLFEVLADWDMNRQAQPNAGPRRENRSEGIETAFEFVRRSPRTRGARGYHLLQHREEDHA